MQYKVVHGDGIVDIEKEVQELMRQGWKPQGGISETTYIGGQVLLVQAMVKAG